MKTFRRTSLLAFLLLIGSSALHAEQMGTNPHPQAHSVMQAVLSFFGL